MTTPGAPGLPVIPGDSVTLGDSVRLVFTGLEAQKKKIDKPLDRSELPVLHSPGSSVQLEHNVHKQLGPKRNEEDRIKNRGARVFTTLYINFSDMQGQILVLVVISGRNLNSSNLSCMSSLPARMRLIKSKMKELECSQDFSYYKSLGIFPDAQGQLTPQSLVRSGRIWNSSEMLWMSSLPANMKKILSKIEALECSQFYTSIFQTRKGR